MSDKPRPRRTRGAASSRRVRRKSRTRRLRTTGGSESRKVEMDETSFREVVEVFELLLRWHRERDRA